MGSTGVIRRVGSIEDVVGWQLCTGCGACAYLEPDRYQMVDIPAHGKRPIVRPAAPGETGWALSACPGALLEHSYDKASLQYDRDLEPCWGPVMDVHEGHATDEHIRKAGSSGGLATALALHAIDSGKAAGVLHTSMDENRPWLNRTTYSRNRDDLIATTGSRYSPSSPCERLKDIVDAPGQSVFIGKPCDVAALSQVQRTDKELARKTIVKIAFFCAGTPSTAGLEALLRREGLPHLSRLRSLRFRGNGWPGRWTAEWEADDGATASASLSYGESWGYLQKYRQWRCHICPDHSGEFADISVGDPWYREIGDEESGSSLIVVRSEEGRRYLQSALESGAVELTRVSEPALLPASQPNLVAARGALWGRVLAMALARCVLPTYKGFPMYRFWWGELDARSKIMSIMGTMKRIIRRKLKTRLQFS
jgi:coenzyme F420 hydrogenase subunit beta